MCCTNAKVPACSLLYTRCIPLVDVYVKSEVREGGGRKEGGREGMRENGNCIESTCSDRDLEKATLDVGMVWSNLSVNSHPCSHTFLGIPTSPFTF